MTLTSFQFLLLLTLIYGLGFLVPLLWREPEGFALRVDRGRKGTLRRLHWSIKTSLFLALTASLFAFVVSSGVSFGWLAPPAVSQISTITFPLGPIENLELGVRLDRLGTFFALIISGFSAFVAIYSFGALKAPHFDDHRHRISAAFNAFVWSTLLVVQVDDVLSLLVALELMSLSFGYLALFKHLLFEAEDKTAKEWADRVGSEPRKLTAQEANKRHNAFLAPQVYLMASHVSTAFLLVAVSILALNAGGVLFGDIAAAAASLDPLEASLVFLLALGGLGIRVGLTPAHVWVPLVHPSSPTPTHALSLGIAIKVGVYLMFRFFFEFTEPRAWWGSVLLLVAGLTALANVWYAIASHDLKEALAYHSIENIGIITAGLGIALIFLPVAGEVPAAPWIAELALIASLYHLLNHAIFKGLLYMATGSIDNLTGRVVEFDRLGGLIRHYHWTSAAFLVGALAISGFPPLNGFISKWLTLQSMFHGAMYGGGTAVATLVLGLILFVASFALTAFCFFKMIGLVFLGQPRLPEGDMTAWQPAGTDSPAAMLGPMAIMAMLCLVLGLLPGRIVPWLAETVQAYVDVELVRHDAEGKRIARTTGLAGVGEWSGLDLPGLTKLPQTAAWRSEDAAQGIAETPPAPGIPMAGLVGVAGVLALLGWLGIRGHVRRPDDAWSCGTPFNPELMQCTAASLSELIRHMGGWLSSGPSPADDDGVATSTERHGLQTATDRVTGILELGEPSEKDRTERIILPEWYRISASERNPQWVREVFRAGYNRLSRWIYDWSSKLGSAIQGGDIRLYVRYIMVTQIAILLLFLARPPLGFGE